ncbi:linearmycin resistance permease LnrM [Georgenia halophila]|uniref:Linearmycin resistance permease LnrM n=1 Tax=Georgenia halophila TaxID=620889 RepID=A0ABP8LMP3_9MICO
MRAASTIAGAELRRFFKDRSNIFFVFIFPLLLVLVIGAQFGDAASSGRVVVVGPGGALHSAVERALEDDGVTVAGASEEEMLEQVARGRADAGLVIDRGDAAAYGAGDPVDLTVVPSSQASSSAAMQVVRTAVQEVALEQAEVVALTSAGVSPDAAREAIADAESEVGRLRIETVDTSEVAQEFSGVGQFDVGAGSQLLLFVFLISLAGSATLIQSRRLGVIRRVMVAPVSARRVLGGQALGRLVIALFQGVYIMAVTALAFGVDWGNLGLSLLVLLLFAAVSAGAAMVLGSVMDNEGAASGAGVGFGLVLAALGGCMVPLELFPDSLQTVAHVTPHAWAYEAFAEIQRHDASLIDVLPQLGVLAAMAAVLLALGAITLRRSLARAM